VAGSVNKVILVGNLGQDPEIRSFQSGDRVANFSIATSESWKDKTTGEKKEKTEWHRVSVTNQGLIKVIENYVKKGSKLYIEGKLETRKWTDQSGVEKYATEVVLRPYAGELTLLDSPRGGQGGGFSDSGYDSSANFNAPYQQQASAGGSNYAPVNDMDDEIPF
jgi:single-strand DNA-binding protein